jgi:predicted phosphodiesterase
MKRCLVLFLLLLSTLLWAQQPLQEVRVVITGNTAPESPYRKMPERLYELVETINRENPDLVIHTGNLVQGGHSWTGLTRQDVKNQFREWKKVFSRLEAPLLTVYGSTDHFNDNDDLYREYTGHPLRYSSALGDLRFIILHHDTNRIPKGDMKWLRRELKQCGNRDIFIVSQRPLVNQATNEELVTLLSNYSIQGVISGSGSGYHRQEVRGLTWIQAGTGRLEQKGYYAYYVMTLSGRNMVIQGKRLR